MTLTRKLALKISGIVLRLSSPGCKDWAEGLAREQEFIESDWRALSWALGSTRVLLDRQEASVGTLDEAFEAAQEFFEKQSSQMMAGGFVILLGSFAILCVIVSAPSVMGIGSSHTGVLQIGLVAALAVALCAAYRAYARHQRELDRPLGRYQAVVKYRDELQRLHEAQHSWSNRLGTLAGCAWIILLCAFVWYSEGDPFFFHFPGVLLLLQLPFAEIRSRLRDRNNLRRIANLDALLASGVEASL